MEARDGRPRRSGSRPGRRRSGGTGRRCPGPRFAGLARRMLVAALRRVERVEAVTEHARRVVRDEGVLAPPARPVRRVVRVEVDEAAEVVGRRPDVRRAEAVDAGCRRTLAAEELLEPAAVHPARLHLELREVARPVRDLEPVRRELRRPRREAEIGQRLRPALRGPVATRRPPCRRRRRSGSPGRRTARSVFANVFQYVVWYFPQPPE